MRVLVIEDEHRIAGTIKKGLEQERMVVDIAYDGESGFDLAISESYDVIVLDLMLPKIDGLTVCRMLRDGHNHVPILMLTAKSQIHEKISGLNSGADDYLTKPFSFEELLARIRALGRRPPSVVPTVLTFDDLTMDTVAFTLTRSGKPIILSSKEFALLEYLMRHPQIILSKNQIIQHVWDYESNILQNTVEVFIRHLRDKVDRPFPGKAPLIHTIRGFGYRLGQNHV